MANDDSSDQIRPFIDIGDILRDAVSPPRRPAKPRATAAARAPSKAEMDAAMRKAVRAELKDVEKAIRLLATEVVRLRRANEELTDKVARLLRS
jgi:hypothetical protein